MERVGAIERETSGCASLYGIDSYDREFLSNAKAHPALTPKQEAFLRIIEKKVFGKGHDGNAAD